MLHVAAAPELFDRILWAGATETRREELARLVEAQLGPEFRYVGLRRYAGAEVPVAVFLHEAAGAFSLVPGGGFDMGLSPEEEAAIRAAREREAEDDDFDQEFDLLLSEIGQMRPLHRVVVPPFLIAQRVLAVGAAQRWLPDLHDPLYGNVARAAAHLSGEQIATILAATGLRLPAEAELEYAARGGLSRRLLPWGDLLPDDVTLEAMLADVDGSTHNALGIHGYGLFPELCADHWRPHYDGAPDDGSAWAGSGLRVVRGGAADCFPWQGCGEWNLMLCALRMNERAAEYGASLRLVRGLDEDDVINMSSGACEEAVTPTKTKARATGKKAAVEATTRTKPSAKATGKKAATRTTPSAKATGKKAAKKAGARATGKTAAKKAGARATGKTVKAKTAGAKAGAKKARAR